MTNFISELVFDEETNRLRFELRTSGCTFNELY